jgi:myo-inositol-1(or 4)-monophosphatase
MHEDALANIVSNALRKIENKILRDFKEISFLQNSQKGAQSFALRTYDYIAKTLYEELKKARPAFGFIINDELVAAPKDECTSSFIMQPIDGFDNFAHGINFFATTIAVKDGENITAYFLANPVENIFLSVDKGGAFLDHNRIKPSQRTNLDDCIIATNMEIPNVRTFYTGCLSMEILYFSCGRLDSCVYKDINIKDFSTINLLIKKSGAVVEEFGKNKIMISTHSLHKTLSSLLKNEKS